MQDETSTVIIQGIRHLPPRRSELYALGDMGYVLSKKIGEGTYARVHKGYYFDSKKGLKVQLACKIFNLRDAPKVFCTVFFPRELSIIATINHPNIVGVHSILVRGPKFFVFMKYGENGDLLKYIREKGAIKEGHAKIWFGQILSALNYLHSRNVVHRDIKCDFGFATICPEEQLSCTYCGSLAYACPEITTGTPYRPRLADCWSAGVILFIMLNGKMPFHEKNLKNLIRCQLKRKYTFQYSGSLSKEVVRLIDKILEPNPKKRYNLQRIITDPWLSDTNISQDYSNNVDYPKMELDFRKMVEGIIKKEEKQHLDMINEENEHRIDEPIKKQQINTATSPLDMLNNIKIQDNKVKKLQVKSIKNGNSQIILEKISNLKKFIFPKTKLIPIEDKGKNIEMKNHEKSKKFGDLPLDNKNVYHQQNQLDDGVKELMNRTNEISGDTRVSWCGIVQNPHCKKNKNKNYNKRLWKFDHEPIEKRTSKVSQLDSATACSLKGITAITNNVLIDKTYKTNYYDHQHSNNQKNNDDNNNGKMKKRKLLQFRTKNIGEMDSKRRSNIKMKPLNSDSPNKESSGINLTP